MPGYLNAAKFLLNKTPSHFIFFVTARCNFKCRHCFYFTEVERAGSVFELSLSEIEKISESMPHIKLLTLTGGEPFFREDLSDIAEIFYRNNSVHHLVVHTNGSFGERIKGFSGLVMENCPGMSLSVSISLDGIGPEHDLIRGKKGAFEKVFKVIDSLQELRRRYRNFEVEITSVVSSFNLGKINELIDRLSEESRIDSHTVEIVRGKTADPAATEVSPDEFFKVVRRYRARQNRRVQRADYPLSSFKKVIDVLTPEVEVRTMRERKMILPCTAGKKVIVLSEIGEVYPCEMLGRSFGNVRENSYNLKRVLFSAEAESIRRFIRRSGCFCTWGCAVSNNLIFNIRAYPMILMQWFKQLFRGVFTRKLP